MCAAFSPNLAEPQPSPTSSIAELEGKTVTEVNGMEDQLKLAIAKRDIPVLDKILADTYFDAYEGAKRAMSKPGTIARCKAGLHNFLAIEKEKKVRRELDIILVEGVARFQPSRVDDNTPEEQWIHVQRRWTKKDGKWLLAGQFRRLIK